MANDNKIWGWISSGLLDRLKEALMELKEANDLLTQISKENDKLSKAQLEEMGNRSFEAASQYGRKAADYLKNVQSALRAGYEDAEGMAELSLAMQNAGHLSSSLAEQYIMAMDRAYGLGGSVEELTAILDGSNSIAGRYGASLESLAQGMTVISQTAAGLGIEADQATAALGAIITATGQGGAEAGKALKAILLSIGQVADADAGIDSESLAQCEKACQSLNVSLMETRDGLQALRDPMEVLEELSAQYRRLGEADPRKKSLLSSLGADIDGHMLDALLRQWPSYQAMLSAYSDGAGSLAADGEKMASSWEGSLNRLANTWEETIGGMADSDALLSAIQGLNGVLSAANQLSSFLGPMGTIGTAAAGFLGAKGLGLTTHTTIS